MTRHKAFFRRVFYTACRTGLVGNIITERASNINTISGFGNDISSFENANRLIKDEISIFENVFLVVLLFYLIFVPEL